MPAKRSNNVIDISHHDGPRLRFDKAAMYFLVPANLLPTFFPVHETGLMRIRAKHGMLSGAIGIVLLIASWFTGRR